MRAKRWSDNDRYYGPFTVARGDWPKWGFLLDSGDGDDYAGCNARLYFGRTTLLVALPAIIKPKRQWHPITTEPTRSQMIAQNREPGYWQSYRREFGAYVAEGTLHYHYGPMTHDSTTDHSGCWFLPWREWRHVRHSLYDLDGEHFADLPDWGARSRHGWTVRNAIEAVCPVARFDFLDFDGERITATCRIEEREWRRGVRWFRWMSLVWPRRVERSLDLQFSAEVGHRKGSWKGGTIGHSIAMQRQEPENPMGETPYETIEAAFRRYCDKQQLTFVGPTPEVVEPS